MLRTFAAKTCHVCHMLKNSSAYSGDRNARCIMHVYSVTQITRLHTTAIGH